MPDARLLQALVGRLNCEVALRLVFGRILMSMPNISLPLLADVSFPDFEVEHFLVDIGQRRLEIKVSGAWLNGNHGGELGPVRLVIGDWDFLNCRSYDRSGDEWIAMPAPAVLKDLCEAEYSHLQVCIRGFERTSGLWTEIKVLSPAQLFLTVEG